MKMDDLVKASYEAAKAKGWYEGPPVPALARHMLMVSEIAEATECVRNNEPAFHTGKNGKPEGEAIELADAVIRIADYFGAMGWSLENMIKTKMAYNETRPHRHGGKVA